MKEPVENNVGADAYVTEVSAQLIEDLHEAIWPDESKPVRELTAVEAKEFYERFKALDDLEKIGCWIGLVDNENLRHASISSNPNKLSFISACHRMFCWLVIDACKPHVAKLPPPDWQAR